MLPPVQPRLSIVTLGARDLASLRGFYERLGFSPDVANETYCSFLLGGVLLALWPIELLAAESGVASGRPAGFTLAWNVDRRELVDPTFDFACAAGATPVVEPTDRDWGGRSGYISDPEGNCWEIAWAPNTTFDARGAVTS